MAETVKKSRIVSDDLVCDLLDSDSTSLQDIINEEFNQRLKSMSNEQLDTNDENEIDDTELVTEPVLKIKNGTNIHSKIDSLDLKYSQNDELEIELNQTPKKSKNVNVLNENQNGVQEITENFLLNEKTNGTTKIFENISNLSDPECDSYVNDENLGLESSPEEEFIPKVSAKEKFLSTVPDLEEQDPDTKISATAKDRLFLASDDACLFFNNRVVQSPMLTPTEENYDFLQGITDTNLTPPETSDPVEIDNSEIVDPLQNDSISEKFSNLNLRDDSIQNITSNFLDSERKSSLDQSDNSQSVDGVDGEIPLVRVTDVTPEAEQKDIFDSYERSFENVEELPQEGETVNQNQKSPIGNDYEEGSVEDSFGEIEIGASRNGEKQELVDENQIPFGGDQPFGETETFGELRLDDETFEENKAFEAKNQCFEGENLVLDENEPFGENLSESKNQGFDDKNQSFDSNLGFSENQPNGNLVSDKNEPFGENPSESKNQGFDDKNRSFDIKNQGSENQPNGNENLVSDKNEPFGERSVELDFGENGETLNIKYSNGENESSEVENTEVMDIHSDDTEIIQEAMNGNLENRDLNCDNMETNGKTIETNHDSESYVIEKRQEIKNTEIKTVDLKTDNKNIKSDKDVVLPKKLDKQFPLKNDTGSKIMEKKTDAELNGIFDIVRKTKELFEEKANSDNFVPKSYNLIKNLDKSPSKHSYNDNEDNDEVFDTNNQNNSFSTSTTSESSFMETTTESKTQEKILKKKKSKKSKKDNEKENISVRAKSMSDIRRDSYTNIENVFGGVSVKQLKSSFSKFDALQKKSSVLHVRSSEAAKAPEKFNGSTPNADTQNCKACSKQVFQMEQIKAEKAIWHKNCFRCQECNKQLTVDTYQSHEGQLYCKPHFKSLFAPKVVEESQPMRPRKHELIIRENEPVELPPDVVRASDKPDLGLEELHKLNMKERFQVFQNQNENENDLERTPSQINVKRSPSILSKLARFQQKGMDVGVNDESLNGVPVEESSTESEEEDDGITGEDADLIRAKRAVREKPLHFNNMSEVMSKWESGNQMSKEERREERKQEIQSIRSKLFMGKQAKIKEMYQQAVAESESGANVKKTVATEINENARLIKEKFERGETLSNEEEQKLKENEDMSVFESGISKKSRSIFLEMDANAAKSPAPQITPVTPQRTLSDIRKARDIFVSRQASEDVVRASDKIEDVIVETKDISNKFKFFETYKEPEKQKKKFRITPPREGQIKESSPDREIYHDPNVVRADEQLDDSEVIQKSHTTTKMLSIFRQMEEDLNKDSTPAGPKPLKRFTPPPEPVRDDESSAEEDSATEGEESEEESDHEDFSKLKDEDLIEAQKAARAKQLRAKFEKWEANEIQREQSSVNIADEFGDEGQVESAKSLRARFESMREVSTTKERPKPKVNRFV